MTFFSPSKRDPICTSSGLSPSFSLFPQVAVETERRDDFSSSSSSGEARDYTYHAGSTNSGRPVYYVVDDSAAASAAAEESLHSDRSPYTYEPADTHTSLVADYTQQAYSGGPAAVGPGGYGGAGGHRPGQQVGRFFRNGFLGFFSRFSCPF